MKKKAYNYLCILFAIILMVAGVYFFYKSTITDSDSNYTESSKAEYTVCLKENDLFKQTCLGEEKQYLSTLSDEIRVTFDYERVNSKQVNTEFNYYIDSNLVIYNTDNNKEIYKDSKNLTESKKYTGDKEVNTIQDKVTIKYDEYNDIVLEQVEKYSLYAKAALELNLVLKENDDEKVVSSVSIPLGLKTYSISKDIIEKNVEIDNSQKNNYLFVSILLIGLDLVFIVIIVLRIFKNSKQSDFELEVKKLLTEYDKIIVETKENVINYDNKQITKLDDFLELVDVRDTIEKPILYIYRDARTRDFVVQDDNIIYIYTMVDNTNGEREVNQIWKTEQS